MQEFSPITFAPDPSKAAAILSTPHCLVPAATLTGAETLLTADTLPAALALVLTFLAGGGAAAGGAAALVFFVAFGGGEGGGLSLGSGRPS